MVSNAIALLIYTLYSNCILGVAAINISSTCYLHAALPASEVAIHGSGNTTAGEMYTLSCTATVVEDLVVVPILQWEYSNGSVVEGESIFTLSAMLTSGNTTTHNLTFTRLRTSHGGEYTCRAIINISSTSISGLSSSQSSEVVVQSKLFSTWL